MIPALKRYQNNVQDQKTRADLMTCIADLSYCMASNQPRQIWIYTVCGSTVILYL